MRTNVLSVTSSTLAAFSPLSRAERAPGQSDSPTELRFAAPFEWSISHTVHAHFHNNASAFYLSMTMHPSGQSDGIGSNSTHLHTIPAELLIKIYGFLPSFTTAFALAATCHRLRRIWLEMRLPSTPTWQPEVSPVRPMLASFWLTRTGLWGRISRSRPWACVA